MTVLREHYFSTMIQSSQDKIFGQYTQMAFLKTFLWKKLILFSNIMVIDHNSEL